MGTSSIGQYKTNVVLLQLGGPDSLDAVEPFLYNLFSDPDIIDFPGAFLFRKKLAKTISSLRSPKVRKLYQAIGGKSPILEQTEKQVQSLAAALNAHGVDADVHVAMRYWNPFTKETYEKLTASGIREVILLPLYPHYSKATTGSSVNEWKRVSRKTRGPSIKTVLVEQYFDHPLFIEALVERVRQALELVPAAERSKVYLLFSAHGTPMKLVKGGDPYSHQIMKTYELVVERGNFQLPHRLCFQSKVGPQKWLRPSLLESIDALAAQHITHVIVIPVSFVSDHIETLSEINIEARHYASARGISYFDMTRPLLTSEKFIGCLTDLVLKKIQTRT